MPDTVEPENAWASGRQKKIHTKITVTTATTPTCTPIRDQSDSSMYCSTTRCRARY